MKNAHTITLHFDAALSASDVQLIADNIEKIIRGHYTGMASSFECNSGFATPVPYKLTVEAVADLDSQGFDRSTGNDR
jgi:hypothetical protein